MEFILQLFVTAFIAVLFSFLIAKIVSWAIYGSGVGVNRSVSGVSSTDVDDKVIMEDLEYFDKSKVEGFESEKKVELVKDGTDNKVEVFETEQDGVVHVEETAHKVDDFEAGEKDESLKDQGFETEIDVKDKMEKMEIEQSDAENGSQVQSEDVGLEKEVKPEIRDEDDDWEGIEKSELENVFGAASKFVERKGDIENVGDDVQMELYELHKVATEGPCRESQPLPFMVSARSKWNAWQRLGNMNPETAMEQYVDLLSDRVPGWMEKNSDGEHKTESTDHGVPVAMEPDITSFPDQIKFKQDSNADLMSDTGGGDISLSTSFDKQAKD